MLQIRTLIILIAGLISAPALAMSALEEAIRAGDTETVAAELAAGADPNAVAETGAPLIVVAASRNALEISDMLLNAGADVNALTSRGASALMWGAFGGDPTLAERLLTAGARVNERDPQGDPAINWAAFYGQTAYARVLLAAGADTSLRGHGNAFEIAIRRGHEDFLQLVADHDGRHLTEEHEGVDDIGRPLIHNAARLGDEEELVGLLAGGAEVDASDLIGFTALMHAAREGQEDVVAALLNAGADVNHRAAPTGLRLTPLHLAAIGGNADIVRLLIARGAALDVQGTAGGTPLRWAFYSGQQEAALALVQAGADPDLTSDGASSPREMAPQFEWQDVVEAMEARESSGAAD